MSEIQNQENTILPTQHKKPTLSNTATRIIVAIIGIPIVVGLLWFGQAYFLVFVLVLNMLGLHELYDMAEEKGFSGFRPLGFLLGAALVFALSKGNTTLFAGILIFSAPIILFAELWRNRTQPLANVAVTILGMLYVSVGFGSLAGLRHVITNSIVQNTLSLQETDIKWAEFWLVSAVFIAIWLCDSIAFFVGKAIGRHKLFERVSPKKSWEGAIAGFLSSAIGFAYLAGQFVPFIPSTHAVALGAFIGIFGQLGDLAESLLKRDAGIKDSSQIIPGHGGILDRFDSILFVAPIVLAYVILFFGK